VLLVVAVAVGVVCLCRSRSHEDKDTVKMGQQAAPRVGTGGDARDAELPPSKWKDGVATGGTDDNPVAAAFSDIYDSSAYYDEGATDGGLDFQDIEEAPSKGWPDRAGPAGRRFA
jgi:hypothetical protein